MIFGSVCGGLDYVTVCAPHYCCALCASLGDRKGVAMAALLWHPVTLSSPGTVLADSVDPVPLQNL